jgi:hypothetical protein
MRLSMLFFPVIGFVVSASASPCIGAGTHDGVPALIVLFLLR